MNNLRFNSGFCLYFQPDQETITPQQYGAEWRKKIYFWQGHTTLAAGDLPSHQHFHNTSRIALAT